MLVESVHEIEDCLDGTVIKELALSEAISRDFVLHLEKYGRLEFFEHLARPFFRLTRDRVCVLTGIVGKSSLRVVFAHYTDQVERELVERIEKLVQA
jgi:hypothetical protein